ncbi:hypothetical protein ON010_g237 [Phytophthora cinnamomi]|nr:hypothetical protein ON010_g237 [Phytophthora cinnamomi]
MPIARRQPVPARAPKGILNTGDCIPTDSNSAYVGGNYYAWYTSSVNSGGSGSSVAAASTPGLSTGAIVGITIGENTNTWGLQRFHPKTQPRCKRLSTGQAGLWSDDVITAKRIPRNRIKIKKLISRGAYGEVYVGRFYRQVVAIKMLLPGTRSSIHHVNQFLSEAKMTASMDHPHIVSFVGVSWDSLSDLCVVLEFMDGGDLRTLLDKYQASGQAPGFNKQKAAIALHICHGLTYLHSLSPPVIHRDLKSRNILLNRAMDAKLTDFGISRERLDQTMTAGVGTSLWMAPEVMLGERYDVMADMFSFGVVLAELDAHTLPYAQAKQRSMDTDGRLMTDAMLLQKITSGDLHVEFSNQNPQSLVELGKACVAVDPDDRPSAAEALYRLQVIAAQELAK